MKKQTDLQDSWETPQDLWDELNKQYKFEIDLCATKENTKCKLFLSDIFNQKYHAQSAWINPPFSIARDCLSKAFTSINPLTDLVGIYRCDNMETSVWQDIIFTHASWVYIFDKRIKYIDPQGSRNSPRFPSALFGAANTKTPKEDFRYKFKGVLIIL